MFKKRLLPALLFSALAGASMSSQAVKFSGVYVFGDSLSDAGIYKPGIAALLGAQAGATLGHFTTNPGPVWSELVSQYYGYTPAPSNVAGGNIYAQGGQRVTLTPAYAMGPGGTERPVSTQITEYLSRGNVDPNALYAVWAGANDGLVQATAFLAGTITQTQLQTNFLAAATAEIGQIARLTSAGARYVLVFSSPDPAATPTYSSSPLASAFTQLTVGYNTTLFTGLQANGIRVIPVDYFTLLNEVRANPAPYGFTNATGTACAIASLPGNSSLFCSPATLVAPNAQNTYMFADGIHPTTGMHKVIADFVVSLIEGPQQLSLLAEAPLHTREGHMRTLDSGLQDAASAPVGKFTSFVGADRAKFDLNAAASNPQTDTKNRNTTVGITMRASEALTLGAGVGKSTSEASFGGGLGGFETNETVVSVFGSAKSGGLYANGAVSISDVQYDRITRNIALGPATRVANATSTGSNASASVTAGFDAAVSKLSVGPFVSYTSQNVDVNSFTEGGAGSASLKIGEQKRISRVVSVGLRASADLGRVTPFARFTLDRELKNNDREVLATPTSIASGNTYGIPAYKGDSSWGTGSLGVRAKLGEHTSLSVVYSSVFSRQDIKQDAVGANVTCQF